MEESKSRNLDWLLYLLSIFPLFGVVIGALNYKKNKPLARNCLGIAIVAVIIYLALKQLAR